MMKFDKPFKTKLVIDDKIYLLLSEADEILDGLITLKYSDYISHSRTTDKDVILQDDFNHILSLEPEMLSRISMFEITKIEEFRNSVNIAVSLLPIVVGMNKDLYKTIAVSKGCESLDEYAQKYILQEKIDEDYKSFLRDTNNYYQQDVKSYKKGLKLLKDGLKKCKLTTQCFTYVNDKSLHLMLFIVGKGIFKQVIVDDFEYYEISLTENGLVLFDGYDKNTIVVNENERDFAQYSVIDNLIYILSSKKVLNTDMDCLEYKQDGIDLFIDYKLALYFFNPNMFGNMMVLDGIVDVSYNKIVVTQND